MRNIRIQMGSNSFDAIQFGQGTRDLIIIPGLGDGLTTVKGKALLGPALFPQYVKDYRITMVSRNNRLQEGATTASMAKDMKNCMDALGISSACIVGVSQGGMIAQHLAADYPQKVEKLVLAVTVPAANAMMIRNAVNWIHLAEAGNFQRLLADINDKANTPEQRQYAWFTDPMTSFLAGQPDVNRFKIQAQACITHDAWDKLPKIQAPTLIIGGQQDRTLGSEGSRQLHKAIAGSRLILYPNQSHALYVHEKDFHRQVLQFLK